MALTPLLQRLATPEGYEIPANPDDILQMVQDYMEINGLEDFNGINYGATTPTEDNRSLPWFRLDGSGVFMGWYIWDGADWSLTNVRLPEVTEAQMNAIASPMGGWAVWNIGSSAIKVYDTASGTWKRAIPEVATVAYDRTYLFDTHQLVATATGASGGWLSVDLTSLKASAGLASETLKAVKVRLNTGCSTGFGGPQSISASIKAHGTNVISTAASDVLYALAYASRDDSACAATAQIAGDVKLSGTTLYWATELVNISTNNAEVWVTGFVY